MCGVAALFRSKGLGPSGEESARSMIATLSHRGPDFADTWSDDRVALGHARLSIIDLSDAANQPMRLGDLHVTYNGEIFNWVEVREELRRDHGIEFRTSSDTEVLLHAYAVWGRDCVDRLNGMFAFILWDAARAELCVARDRLGVKPLYFSEEPDGTLVFASEPRAIWARTPVGGHVDLESIGLCLGTGFYPGHRCGDVRIQSFPAGTVATYRDGSEDVRRYWSVWSHGRHDVGFDEAVARTRELLHDATRIRLRSDVTAGLFLSGGMDSSLVAAIAAEEAGRRLEAFTIRVGDKAFDEEAYARNVAERFGLDLAVRTLNSDALNTLPRIVSDYGDVFADSSALPQHFIAGEASQRLTVVLTGDGGDEAFGGYVVPFAAHLGRHWARVPRAIRSSLAALARRAGGRSAGRALRWPIRLNEMSLADVRGAYRDFCVQSIWGRVPGALHLSDPAAAWDPFEGAGETDVSTRSSVLRHAEVRDQLGKDFLVKVDRGTMAHSLEGRSPFLDYRIMEFGLGLPDSVVYHGLKRKAVLRQLCIEYFGADFVNRPKMGFSVPVGPWMASPRYWDAVTSIALRDSEIWWVLDRGVVERLVGTFRSDPNRLGPRMWSVLWAQLWLALFAEVSITPDMNLLEAGASLTDTAARVRA